MVRRSLLASVCLVTGLLLAAAASAFTLEEYAFDEPARQAEFRELLGEIRCLVCQNESLAGSQAGLAQDLRNEVYRLMQEGRSRAEVVDFLVARYGDFVLYDPPFKLSTLPLWLGPIVLAVIGVIVLRRAIASRQPVGDETLSADEQARLQALLESSKDNTDQQDPHR